MKRKQTFIEAVRQSADMSPAQKAYWEGVVRIERYQRKMTRRRTNLTKRAMQSFRDRQKARVAG